MCKLRSKLLDFPACPTKGTSGESDAMNSAGLGGRPTRSTLSGELRNTGTPRGTLADVQYAMDVFSQGVRGHVV